jgi:hypothetical protein
LTIGQDYSDAKNIINDLAQIITFEIASGNLAIALINEKNIPKYMCHDFDLFSGVEQIDFRFKLTGLLFLLLFMTVHI